MSRLISIYTVTRIRVSVFMVEKVNVLTLVFFLRTTSYARKRYFSFNDQIPGSISVLWYFHQINSYNHNLPFFYHLAPLLF